MSHQLHFPTPVCDKDGCPRIGEPLRWNTERRLFVKGSQNNAAVLLKVFLCEQYGPQKTLHTHYTGPHGEVVTRINNHGGFSYRDNFTGNTIETTCGIGPRKMSKAVRQKLSAAITKRFWANPEDKKDRIAKHTEAVKRAWADPVKGARMRAANQRKSEDPSFGERISEGKLRAFAADPEKRRRVSEAVRAARRKERAIILAGRKDGRPATRASIFTEAHRLHQSGLSWSKIAKRLIPSEYNVDPEAAADRIKKGARYHSKRK